MKKRKKREPQTPLQSSVDIIMAEQARSTFLLRLSNSLHFQLINLQDDMINVSDALQSNGSSYASGSNLPCVASCRDCYNEHIFYFIAPPSNTLLTHRKKTRQKRAELDGKREKKRPSCVRCVRIVLYSLSL